MVQTDSKSCNKLNLFKFVTIKNEFGGKPYKIFSLKTETVLQVLRLDSKIYRLIIADGKDEFFKKVSFLLTGRILPTVLVTYGALLTEMRLKRYFGCSCLETL